jgi:hypothetical protein
MDRLRIGLPGELDLRGEGDLDALAGLLRPAGLLYGDV